MEHQHLPAAWNESDEARSRLIRRRISDPLDGLPCGLYRWSGPWTALCPCCGRFEVSPEPIGEHFDTQRVAQAQARKKNQDAEASWRRQRGSAETRKPPTVVFNFETPEDREELAARLGLEVDRSSDRHWRSWYPDAPDDGPELTLTL